MPNRIAHRKRIAISNGDGTSMIPLSRGLFATVDDSDVLLVTTLTWSARPDRSNPGSFYAVAGKRDGGKLLFVKMQNLILPPPPGLIVDHRNRNGLDNRRHNLRHATEGQNAANRQRPVGKSGFIGVRVCRGKYLASVRCGGATLFSACFADPSEAARARDAAALAAYGEFAVLNFPQEAINAPAR